MSFYPCCICLYECFYFLHMPFFSMFVGMSMTSKEIFGSIVGYLEPLSSCEEPAIVKKKKKSIKTIICHKLTQTSSKILEVVGRWEQQSSIMSFTNLS